jgi:hypothetical protein
MRVVGLLAVLLLAGCGLPPMSSEVNDPATNAIPPLPEDCVWVWHVNTGKWRVDGVESAYCVDRSVVVEIVKEIGSP